MKNLDERNESAPDKFLERRKALKLSQLKEIEELKDSEMYEESAESIESPTRANVLETPQLDI